MSNWKIAPALETLREQLNKAFPKRSKASDGGIGDEKHASRNSDHNPWVKDSKGKGVVTARDFTHDPKTGIDCQWLADTLVANKDPRIKYIIWNKEICSSTKAWEWRAYKGINGHTHHLHLSVNADPKHYDAVRQWKLAFPKEKSDDIARVEQDSAVTHINNPDNPTVDATNKQGNLSEELPPDFTEGERPTMNIEHADKVINEPPPVPPKNDPVTVKTERTSIWTKIAVIFAAITGMGINLGNLVNNKLNEMNLQQLGYMVAGVVLIAASLWAYDRAQSRAHAKTMAKVDTASDPGKNTVELER